MSESSHCDITSEVQFDINVTYILYSVFSSVLVGTFFQSVVKHYVPRPSYTPHRLISIWLNVKKLTITH